MLLEGVVRQGNTVALKNDRFLAIGERDRRSENPKRAQEKESLAKPALTQGRKQQCTRCYHFRPCRIWSTFPAADTSWWVQHHGDRSGQKSSILQNAIYNIVAFIYSTAVITFDGLIATLFNITSIWCHGSRFEQYRSCFGMGYSRSFELATY